MKKIFYLLFVFPLFFGCGDSNDSSKKDSASTKNEPENLCECLEMGFEKMQKISHMTDEALSENLNIYDDFKKEMESNEKCNEFAKKAENKYESIEEFIKSCPVAKETEALKIKIKKRISNLKGNNNQTAQFWFDKAINSADNNYRINCFTKCLDIDSDFYAAYNQRGISYHESGRYLKAINDYNSAIKINPDDAEVYINRGVAYDDLGSRNEALADFNTALGIDRNNSRALNMRGQHYYSKGLNKRALQDISRALEIKPNYALAYSSRAVIYRDLGNYQEALDDFNNAIKYNQNEDNAYYNRASLFIEIERYQEAIDDCNKVIQINPDFAEAYWGLAISKYYLGLDGCPDLKMAKALGSGFPPEAIEQICN